MAGSSFANNQKALAVNYDRPFRGKVGWSKGALAGMLTKVVGAGITGPVIPIRSGNSPAVSASFANAQAQAAIQFTKTEQFAPAWVKKYGLAQIDGLLMAAAQGSGGLFDKFCVQIDGMLDGVMNQFSADVYRSGSGYVGRIATAAQGETLASTTLVLANPEDIVHFGKGMRLVASATEFGALKDAGAVVTVTGISALQAGTLLLSGNLTATITTATFGDFLFIEGNHAASQVSVSCLPGIDAWLPITPFAGVDISGAQRNTDALLLGTILDTTTATSTVAGANKEDLCIEAITASARYGGNPEKMVYFTNPTNYKQLIQTGMSKFRPTMVKGPYGIGFQGARIMATEGEVMIMPDRYCPVQRSYLLDMSSWKYYGAGSAEVPRFLNADGVGEILRMTAEDSVESRAGYYGTIGCNNPPVNVVTVHSTT